MRQMAQFGKPDLICETAGDVSRLYLPGAKRPAWPHSEQIFYYFESNREIIFHTDGSAAHKSIDPAEMLELRQRADRLASRKK
jgi:hypothetical protein